MQVLEHSQYIRQAEEQEIDIAHKGVDVLFAGYECVAKLRHATSLVAISSSTFYEL
jgi:hypothetical protein